MGRFCGYFVSSIVIGIISVIVGVLLFRFGSPELSADFGLYQLLLGHPHGNEFLGYPPLFSEGDIPDLRSKVAIVTGGNAGLGRYTVRALAMRGAHVILASRSKSEGERVMNHLLDEQEVIADEDASRTQTIGFIEVIPLDLSDLQSIKDFVAAFRARGLPLHMLINNAGVFAVPYGLTRNGVETHFQVNHLGHFYLTNELSDILIRSAPSRVVTVSSVGHIWAKHPSKYGGIRNLALPYNDENSSSPYNNETYSPVTSYCFSKLANILFANELARRISQQQQKVKIYSNSLDPGSVHTRVQRHVQEKISSKFGDKARFYYRKLLEAIQYHPRQGALTQLFLATSPKIEEDRIQGEFFRAIATPAVPSSLARNATLARELWEFSEKILKEKGFPLFKKFALPTRTVNSQ